MTSKDPSSPQSAQPDDPESGPTAISRRRLIGGAAATAGGLALAAAGAQTVSAAGLTPMSPGSAKKGVSIGSGVTDAARRINALNPTWYYTWGTRPVSGVNSGVWFAPMVFGHVDQIGSQIADIKAQGAFTHVLGPNEPDLPAQADMTVDQVIAAWPDIQQLATSVGSPALGHFYDNQDWIVDFYDQIAANGYRCNFHALHFYTGTLDVDHFLAVVAAAHQVSGRGVWITEFAVTNASGTNHTAADVLAFMRDLLPALEAVDYLHYYAWFGASPTASELESLRPSRFFDDDGNITPLGDYYRDFTA